MRAALVLGGLATFGCQSGVGPFGGSTGQPISFSQQVQPIFDTHCVRCHYSTQSISGLSLDLSAGESYASLVNRPSDQDANFLLVRQGDSAGSLLYLKVSSDVPPVGRSMPLLGARLSGDEQALLRDWIDQGASNN